MTAMPDGRTAILDRIRSGVAGEQASAGPVSEYATIPRVYVRAGQLDPEARLHLFLDRLRDYDTHVVETSAASLPLTIAAVLREHNQRRSFPPTA